MGVDDELAGDGGEDGGRGDVAEPGAEAEGVFGVRGDEGGGDGVAREDEGEGGGGHWGWRGGGGVAWGVAGVGCGESRGVAGRSWERWGPVS